MGDPRGVQSFVNYTCQPWGVPLKRLKQKFQLDLGMLPDTVNSRLGVTQLDKMAFVLDFAWSTTTADAVLQYNAEDGGNRQFVRVQLPEPNNEKSEAFMAGHETIAEISRERIRHAESRLIQHGRRVLQTGCHRSQANQLLTDNIKSDRKPEDLLFQILLDSGVYLSFSIRKESIQGTSVFFVDKNALVSCFDTGVNEELAKGLACFEQQ